LKPVNSTGHCAQDDEDYDNCKQPIPQKNFEKIAYGDWDKDRVKDTMNMPYDVMFSDIVTEVDQGSGYTTKYDSYYEYALAAGNHFFIGAATATPIIARVTTKVDLNMNTFINEVYPKNGTA